MSSFVYLRVLGGGFCFLPGPRENCGLEELARVLGQHQKQIIETTTKDTKGSTKATKVSFASLVVDFVFSPGPAELARIRNFQEIFTIPKART